MNAANCAGRSSEDRSAGASGQMVQRSTSRRCLGDEAP
jgi:hypothetical protein